MNTFLAPEVAPKKMSFIKIALITIVLILLIGIVFIGFRTYLSLSSLTPTPAVTEEVSQQETLAGTLFLSYTKKGTAYPQLFGYDVATKKITPIPGTEYVYAYSKADNGIDAYSFNTTDGSYLEIETKDANGQISTTKVTPSVPGRVEHLAWNTDGTRLAFEVAPQNTANRIPDDVTIVVLDLKTQEQTVVAHGISPVFQDTTRLFYLKENGVYAASALLPEDGEETLSQHFVYTAYKTTIDSKAVLSPDKKQLLVSHPAQNKVEFHNVVATDTSIVLANGFEILETMYAPYATPNGQYVVYTNDTNTEISAIDFVGAKKIESVPIDAESSDALLINFAI